MEKENGELEQVSRDKLAADLLQSITLHNLYKGRIDIELEEGANLNGWKVVTAHGLYVTVINPELEIFGKAFLPEASQYADESFKATRELAELPLSTPILAPDYFYPPLDLEAEERAKIMRDQGAMIMYPLGDKVVGKKEIKFFYGILYTPDEQKKIKGILDKHDLITLSDDGVPLVRVGGKQYLVDPFNDSVPEIEDYNYRREHGLRTISP